LKARFLVDKSALERMPVASVRERLAPILEMGEAATCAIIDLEVLYSARNAEDHQQIRHRRAFAYHKVPMTQSMMDRALAIQAELAKMGRHRVPIPDLLIAAVALEAGLTVLHYDHHFDLIAEVTGQPAEWVVERGSV
jgi:predicted nucleic acid-binding protein